MTNEQIEAKKHSINRRDFLKLSGLSAVVLALWQAGCARLLTTPETPLSEADFDAAVREMNWPQADETISKPGLNGLNEAIENKDKRFKVEDNWTEGGKTYRVVRCKSIDTLRPDLTKNDNTRDNKQWKAYQEINAWLNNYESVLFFQEQDENGNWKTIDLPHSFSVKDTAWRLIATIKDENLSPDGKNLHSQHPEAVASLVIKAYLDPATTPEEKERIKTQYLSVSGTQLADTWINSLINNGANLRTIPEGIDPGLLMEISLANQRWASCTANERNSSWIVAHRTNTLPGIFIPKLSRKDRRDIKTFKGMFDDIPSLPEVWIATISDYQGIHGELMVRWGKENNSPFYKTIIENGEDLPKLRIRPSEDWHPPSFPTETDEVIKFFGLKEGGLFKAHIDRVEQLDPAQINFGSFPDPKGKMNNNIKAAIFSEPDQNGNKWVTVLEKSQSAKWDPIMQEVNEYSGSFITQADKLKDFQTRGIRQAFALGLLTPLEALAGFMQKIQDLENLGLSLLAVPESDRLKYLWMAELIELIKNDSRPDYNSRIVVASGDNIPVFELSGVKYPYLPGSDKLEVVPLYENNGQQVELKKGEMMPISGSDAIIEIAGEKFLILYANRGENSDLDKLLAHIINGNIADVIKGAVAVRQEDAVKGLQSLEPHDQIKRTIKEISAAIGISAAVILYLCAPEAFAGLVLLPRSMIESYFYELMAAYGLVG